MEINLVHVTTEMAKRWLADAAHNRSLRRRWIIQLASDMESDRWFTTHQPIAFDCEGRLRDGQHRLSAVVMSGCTVDMMVAVDCPEVVFEHCDEGAKRQLTDRLVISGIADKSVAGRMAGVARAMLAGMAFDPGCISNDVVIRCCERYKREIDWSIMSAGKRLPMGPVYAVIAKAVILHGKESMVEFCRAIRDNVHSDNKAPTNHLCRALEESRNRRIAYSGSRRSSGGRLYFYRLTVAAVKHHASGTNPYKLAPSKTDIGLVGLLGQFLDRSSLLEDMGAR